ncbi:MAG: twitching motility protein PilT [Nitrosopumilaceae archaeon]|nr:twitching motility protein PilT [Nitrosopumilaceae archaeon]
MVEVICDTNFLIHLATRRIKNIDEIQTEIGSLSFVVPQVVKNELLNLKKIPEKKHDILETLKFIKNFKIIPIKGKFADKELIAFVKTNGGIIGTMDKELKKEVKKNQGSIISFSNDKIVLES